VIRTHIAGLAGATFIVPLRVDSVERARNIAHVISYLTTKLDAAVIVQEVDRYPKFGAYVLRFLAPILPPGANLQYLFESEWRRDGIFHRTRVLNDMILRATTPVVINYDADVLLPLESYHAAVGRLLAGRADVVYPYALGSDVQRKVFVSTEVMIEFAATGYRFNVLDAVSRLHGAAYGHCQFFRRETYISGYWRTRTLSRTGPRTSSDIGGS
jgi:hypothetical protein